MQYTKNHIIWQFIKQRNLGTREPGFRNAELNHEGKLGGIKRNPKYIADILKAKFS